MTNEMTRPSRNLIVIETESRWHVIHRTENCNFMGKSHLEFKRSHEKLTDSNQRDESQSL
jgi:hypothetical protein